MLYFYTLGLVFYGLKLVGHGLVIIIIAQFRLRGKLLLFLAFWQKEVDQEVFADAHEEAKLNYFERKVDNLKLKVARRIQKLVNWTNKDSKDFLVNNAIYLVIAGLIIFVIIQRPSFLSVRVMRNILTQSSVRLILAFGVGGIIILQGTDLSLGRSVGFAAIISASLLQSQTYGSRFILTCLCFHCLFPLSLRCW